MVGLAKADTDAFMNLEQMDALTIFSLSLSIQWDLHLLTGRDVS